MFPPKFLYKYVPRNITNTQRLGMCQRKANNIKLSQSLLAN